MDKALIIVSSVTYALRGQGLLASAGVKSQVNRTKNRSGQKGCSYSLSVPQDKADEAVRILQSGGIKVLGRTEGNGSV